MDLYHVSTTVPEYSDHRDVVFSWFRHGDQKPRAYVELIEDYESPEQDAECWSPSRYAEEAIDELFTFIEANALKEYLDREHGGHGVTTIEKVKLSLPNNIMGVSCAAVGGGTDFLMLNTETAYSLPFSAWGYFDLRHCERVGPWQAQIFDGKEQEFPF